MQYEPEDLGGRVEGPAHVDEGVRDGRQERCQKRAIFTRSQILAESPNSANGANAYDSRLVGREAAHRGLDEPGHGRVGNLTRELRTDP